MKNIKTKITKWRSFDESGKTDFSGKDIYYYSKNGRLINGKSYDEKGKLNSLSKYRYYKKGSVQEEAIYTTSNKLNGILLSVYHKSRLLLEFGSSPDEILSGSRCIPGSKAYTKKICGHASELARNCLKCSKFDYDKKGNLTVDYHYDQKGKLQRKLFNQYDSNNKLIKSEAYQPAGNKTKKIYKTTYKYDAYGNEIGGFSYKGNGLLSGVWSSKYNSNGNLIEETSYGIKQKNRKTIKTPKLKEKHSYTFY